MPHSALVNPILPSQTFFFLINLRIKINNATSPKLYWSYYPHRSRDSLSPVCGIFFLILSALLVIPGKQEDPANSAAL